MNIERKSRLSQEEIHRWFAKGIGVLVVIAGLLIPVYCMNKDLSKYIHYVVCIWGAFLVVIGLGVAFPETRTFVAQIFSSFLSGFRKKIPGKVASAAPAETPSVSAPPATSRSLELPHEEGPLPQIGALWRSVDEARQPIFDVLGPSYILDDTYHFLDWNPAFDEVVAKQLELRRGWHAGTFIEHLQNLSEVVERSKKVFAPGKIPLIDTEVLDFKSEKYGLIKFQKIASQIADEHGGTKAWAVSLNILEAEDEGALWKDIQIRLSREINWSKYAVSYDKLLLNFDDYLELLDKIVGEVGDAQRCIDIGAGTGNGTVRLLKAKQDREVWAVDNNEAMLQYMKDKAKDIPDIGGQLVIVKEDVQRLEEYPSVYFDAAIMINVLYAVDDRVKCLRQVYRLLKPGGLVVLSTSHKETDLDRLFSKIQDVLKNKGKWEELKDDFRQARNRHNEMDALIHRDTKEDIRSYIEKAGFSIKKWLDGEYVGAVVIVVAEKVIN